MPRPKSTDGIQRETDRTSCQRKPLPQCETSDCASEGESDRLCEKERSAIVQEGKSERISSQCFPLGLTCSPSSSQKVDDEEVEHDRAKEKVAKCSGRGSGACQRAAAGVVALPATLTSLGKCWESPLRLLCCTGFSARQQEQTGRLWRKICAAFSKCQRLCQSRPPCLAPSDCLTRQ